MIEFLLIIILIFLLIWTFFKRNHHPKSACIVVLGDIGRSPRMSYHCISLLKLGYSVTLIGYKESKLMNQLNDDNVKIFDLTPYPKWLQLGTGMAQYGLKTIFLSFTLAIRLVQMRVVPKFILVQNPPSIPTLIVVYLYCRLFGCKFLIDWHNYGHTILALKKGKQNFLVKICKKIEIFFGQRSHLNFCVTKAMCRDLHTYGIKAKVFYDKPHESFRRADTFQKQFLIEKLIKQKMIPQINENCAFLVSSSSWTEDEDFQILIDALRIYEKFADSKLAKIVLFLTGKGPLKHFYERKFRQENFSSIQVNFVWLDPGDYPILLGSCDLGICLHMSSSDLDLPMKVVDMFGAQLPVCAYSFSW
ncbi:chitobiosyldiphosphodolichol beta-mannosyltransferase [Brachionus plicatilis]|uniref:Chitobiosyldiphosphodolichol beta-mannosyltransferase n=1 Tax=Brachionus plicatilis TaxID=10195 RepID=A0A3M7SFK4_BRAPC|nr:chitobiosyldiphosphodolichol beta-mannosyltransferase [Brachionus plicatilis]